MRVIICGDTHIGAVFGLGRPTGNGSNTRIEDYEKSLNHVIDYAIDTAADIFIQTGDLFEHRSPTPEHINVANKALKRLSKANIATVVIMGNHDYRRNGESFTSSITSLAAKDYSNVRMVIEPEVMMFHNSKNEKVNILLMPFRDRKMYPGDSCEEQSAGYNEHVKGLIGSVGNKSPIISVGHNFFFEGSYNDYGGAEVMADTSSFEGCDLAVMGHLHNFRVLKKSAPACVYTGSMERTNFGDANVDKYFIDYNVGTKKAKFCKIPVRDLIDFTIDVTDSGFSNCKDRMAEEIDKLDLGNKIARAKVLVSEAVLPAADKTFVQKYVYDSGAFYLSKVIIEPVMNRIVRDSAILDHSDDYSMFEAFIESQDFGLNIKEKLLSEAKEIIG